MTGFMPVPFVPFMPPAMVPPMGAPAVNPGGANNTGTPPVPGMPPGVDPMPQMNACGTFNSDGMMYSGYTNGLKMMGAMYSSNPMTAGFGAYYNQLAGSIEQYCKMTPW